MIDCTKNPHHLGVVSLGIQRLYGADLCIYSRSFTLPIFDNCLDTLLHL